jgi:HAD superfamily hydrolase (TIGR01509 family)
MMLRAIVFDFDGVLADSEPTHFVAFRDVLAGAGIALTKAAYYGRYLGFDDLGVFRAVAADSRASWSRDRLAELTAAKAARVEELEREIPVLFPGADAVVRRAAARVPLAIASGALGIEIRRVLDRAGLTSSFDAIVAAEDCAATKPAPEPYTRALALLAGRAGAPLPPSSVVAVEDARWGIQSARAAGLRTVAVMQTYRGEELAGADLVIPTIADLDLDALDRLCSG